MSPGSQRRVLVVDDDEDLLSLYEMVLAPLSIETARATNGREAVAAAAAFRPDIVLLDLDMPVMGGVEALRRIRAEALDPAPAIVLLSASVASSRLRRQLQEEGASPDAFLAKPFDFSDLVALVRRLLGGASTGPTGHVVARLASGEKLGEFAVARRLEEMEGATLYAARQESLDREVLLVVAPAHDAVERERSRWLKTLALSHGAAKHPNVLRVVDQGFEEGMRYAAMQSPGGPTLAEAVARGLSALAAATLLEQLAGAAAALTARGVDRIALDPATTWITVHGQAKAGMILPEARRVAPVAAVARLFDVLAGARTPHSPRGDVAGEAEAREAFAGLERASPPTPEALLAGARRLAASLLGEEARPPAGAAVAGEGAAELAGLARKLMERPATV